MFFCCTWCLMFFFLGIMMNYDIFCWTVLFFETCFANCLFQWEKSIAEKMIVHGFLKTDVCFAHTRSCWKKPHYINHWWNCGLVSSKLPNNNITTWTSKSNLRYDTIVLYIYIFIYIYSINEYYIHIIGLYKAPQSQHFLSSSRKESGPRERRTSRRMWTRPDVPTNFVWGDFDGFCRGLKVSCSKKWW